MEYLLLVLLLVIGGAAAQFNVVPSNTVVLDGAANTTFSCAPSNSTHRINWQTQSAGTIAFNCALEPGYDTSYRVVKNQATGQCDLIIISASPSLAGQYICIDESIVNASRNAELVVLASDPVCTQSPQHLYHDDRLNVGCFVSFSGNIAPSFVWDSNGQNLITFDTSNSSFVNSSGYIVPPAPAPGATIKPVSCSIGFPPSTIFTPFNWTSTSVPIQFSPINLQITGGDFTDSLFLGTVISCSADAYPAPRYEWQNYTANNNTLGSGETYTLTVPGNYTLQCVVTNTILNSDGVGSWDSSASKAQLVMVNNSTAPPPTATESPDKKIISSIVQPIQQMMRRVKRMLLHNGD